MNDGDWSETTEDRDSGAAPASDDSLTTAKDIEETLDLIADLLAVLGHGERAIRAAAASIGIGAETARRWMTAAPLPGTFRPRSDRRVLLTTAGDGDTLAPVNRLRELLSRRELRRGRDDAELDELGRLLAAYRRTPGPWKRCEIEGRTAYRRDLDCGHGEFVLCESEPRGGIITEPDGTERELPLSAVCHECYRARGSA